MRARCSSRRAEDAARGLGGLSADLGDAAQEEREPALPVAGVAHGLQAVVVLLRCRLK